ncbi:amidohydrolase [Brevibacillus fluminis]|uniref:Amidohydrolase n=1 Tax=Brevibacillus fluminis TaxID=511487 RepID=A0A3M8DRA2_9BACL|nr:amidohydrolase [Brevibacillus fluminis]RNB90678.1 amidohydrolase [Brevibacillus fluminis]
MRERVFARLEALYPKLVAIRRDLHMYPELSFQEVRTPQKIADAYREWGLEVREQVGGRGVVAVLRGEKPGRTVALRADFDALPIQDEKEVPYKSRMEGVMHACGHDIHTASLLGVAETLAAEREALSGTVVFIHQFAEEVPPGGAIAMIEDGCLEGVDVIFGAHVASILPLGVIGVKEGYLTAASDNFTIEISGKGGHGAGPHLTVDALVTGSQLVTALQQIVSRRVDPLQPAVLTIGTFMSGGAPNVIAQTAKIEGTVRTFDEVTRSLMEEAIGTITHATAAAAGARAIYDYSKGYPAGWNHPGETRQVERIAKELFGFEQVMQLPAGMGGEDFAYYLQRVPGSFYYVGGGNAEIGASYPHHHPRFDVDERSMLHIGKLFLALVLDSLSLDHP